MPFGNKSLPTIVRMVKVNHNSNARKECDREVLTPIDAVRHQLYLANRYKHLVIDAFLAGRELYRSRRAELYPEYDAHEKRAKTLEDDIAAIDASIKKAKSSANRAGKKFIRPVELVQQRTALREARKSCFEQLRLMRNKIKDNPALKMRTEDHPLMRAADQWANHPTDKDGNVIPGPVLYQATKRKVKETVYQGAQLADPIHKKWDGGGRIAVQLQHPWQGWNPKLASDKFSEEAKKKMKAELVTTHAATWENIKKGLWSTIVQVSEVPRYTWHYKDGKRVGKQLSKTPLTIFRIRIASDENGRPVFVDCPCILDEGWKWAPDAHCTWVYLICRANGRGYTYSLSFHLAREDGWDKEDQSPTGVVAVHPGYQRVKSGIRVASWIGDDGEEGELIIPNDDEVIDHADYWRRERIRGVSYAIDKVEDLQKIRDIIFNRFKNVLRNYFKRPQRAWTAPLKEWLDKVTLAEKKLKRKVGSKSVLLDLLRDWRNQPWTPEMREEIADWCYKETHLERWQTKQSAKWERHRFSRYRTFWARLRRRYHTVILTDIDWAGMRRNPPAEERKNPAFSKFRNIAAPGLLAGLAPSPVLKIDPENITKTCHNCGCLCSIDASEPLHECEECGEIWDKGFNAAHNCLARGQKVLENDASCQS